MFRILYNKKNYNVSIQMNYYFYFENILFEYLLCEFLFYYYEFEFLNWIY